MWPTERNGMSRERVREDKGVRKRERERETETDQVMTSRSSARRRIEDPKCSFSHFCLNWCVREWC
jgi:hypothetical protein